MMDKQIQERRIRENRLHRRLLTDKYSGMPELEDVLKMMLAALDVRCFQLLREERS